MSMPGMWELLVIAGVVVLLFGAKKLPQLGGAIGESIRNFKKGINDETKTLDVDRKTADANKGESSSTKV